jgi:hypothetical protein
MSANDFMWGLIVFCIVVAGPFLIWIPIMLIAQFTKGKTANPEGSQKTAPPGAKP